MFEPTKIYTVTELNTILDKSLSEHLVIVQGEVSDFKINQDKFVFFELKDENSRISCFLMKFKLLMPLEDGMEIRLTGRPSVFSRYGKLTFRVETMEPVGEGALRRSYELLKQKLETEGLFDPARKKPLPHFPEKIGIITSEQAAAFTDVTCILRNRWSGLEIFLKPVLVQGADAPEEIVSALEYFNKYFPVDLLILTRGGGSLLDLHAFNSEIVCRAVFASRIPIIVGVGHERDITLVEFIADRRASTPSNAAEMAVPDKREWEEKLRQNRSIMQRGLLNRVQNYQTSITEIRESLKLQFIELLLRRREKIQNLIRFLSSFDPRKKLREIKTLIMSHRERIFKAMQRVSTLRGTKLSNLRRILISFDPEMPLERGYSLSYVNGKLLHSIEIVEPMDTLTTKLRDGIISSRVEKKSKDITP